MSKKEKEKLKRRFAETSNIGGPPSDIVAIKVNILQSHDGSDIHQMVQISSDPKEPNGVRFIWDTKPQSSATYTDYIEAQIKAELLQANKDFVELKNPADLTSPQTPHKMFVSLPYIRLYTKDHDTQTLTINNHLVVSGKDRLKVLERQLDKLGMTDDWIEFKTPKGLSVYLNKTHPFASIGANGHNITIVYEDRPQYGPSHILFEVDSAQLLIESITDSMTSPAHSVDNSGLPPSASP